VPPLRGSPVAVTSSAKYLNTNIATMEKMAKISSGF